MSTAHSADTERTEAADMCAGLVEHPLLAIMWNPYNQVTQCHRWSPADRDPDSGVAVHCAACSQGQFLDPARIVCECRCHATNPRPNEAQTLQRYDGSGAAS